MPTSTPIAKKSSRSGVITDCACRSDEILSARHMRFTLSSFYSQFPLRFAQRTQIGHFAGENLAGDFRFLRGALDDRLKSVLRNVAVGVENFHHRIVGLCRVLFGGPAP